ncbi:lipoprotein [Rhizobacter sp. OV335]|uniref:LPS translocon maturation chaperone LptM n=1 Tax=Rhizobacter sp. OV335 TaxID=1500264 RepID=UPI0009FB1A39
MLDRMAPVSAWNWASLRGVGTISTVMAGRIVRMFQQQRSVARRPSTLGALMSLAAVLALAACGQKGPLKLPSPAASAPAAAASAPLPASAPSP